MAVILNPDKTAAQAVLHGLKMTGGYCPCRAVKNEDTKCICKEFREMTEDPDFEGFCRCMLYYKTKD